MLLVKNDRGERYKDKGARDTLPNNSKEKLLVYFTRLLIPLTERLSNGTVFFAVILEYE
ncbi:hypothetical protein JCM13991_13430 [Thermodesulfovibrio hydrogeniphilus]